MLKKIFSIVVGLFLLYGNLFAFASEFNITVNSLSTKQVGVFANASAGTTAQVSGSPFSTPKTANIALTGTQAVCPFGHIYIKDQYQKVLCHIIYSFKLGTVSTCNSTGKLGVLSGKWHCSVSSSRPVILFKR